MNAYYKGQPVIGQPSLKYTAGDGIEITQTETGAEIGLAAPVQGIVTQAEFDALPEAQKNKGLYIISDGGDDSSGGQSAIVINGQEAEIPSGKSAYEYAQEGGYAGTEAEFSQLLADAASKAYVDAAIGGAMEASY